eukprot:TRINITY_DN1598_c0_g1_i1.p1 TRINITY_DN1598_c0_g1~~TRINITY_DN1598_c0_g1_i1.p1  ORF type:complete len:470 (+),score=57.53 TRINITY_DN1598_c0_g1_i1:1782-3191(+)
MNISIIRVSVNQFLHSRKTKSQKTTDIRHFFHMNRNPNFLFLCVLLLLSGHLIVSCQVLSIMDSAQEMHVFDVIPARFFNETLDMFYVRPFSINGSLTNDERDYAGKLYLRPYLFGVDEEARALVDEGVLGIIMGTTRSSLKGRARYQLTVPRKEVEMIVVQVSNDDYALIESLLENGIVWAAIEGDNDFVNPYDQAMLNVGTMTQVILGLFFGGILALCIYLLIFEIQGDLKNTFTRHRIVLLISLLVSNIARFLFVIYDPYSYKGYSTWPISAFIHFFNIPMTIVNELVVSLLWFKTLRATLMKNNDFLVLMRMPFIVIISVFSILELISIIIISINPRYVENMITIGTAVVLAVLVIIAIYHLIVASVFYISVNKIKKRAALKKNHKSFIIKVGLMSIADLIVFLLLLLVFFPGTYTGSLLKLFFLLAVSGAHSCIILTLFSWTVSSFHTTGTSKSNVSTLATATM